MVGLRNKDCNWYHTDDDEVQLVEDVLKLLRQRGCDIAMLLYSGDPARVDVSPVPEEPVLGDAAAQAEAEQVEATTQAPDRVQEAAVTVDDSPLKQCIPAVDHGTGQNHWSAEKPNHRHQSTIEMPTCAIVGQKRARDSVDAYKNGDALNQADEEVLLQPAATSATKTCTPGHLPEPSVEQRSRLGGSGHHTVGLRQLGVVALQMLGWAGSGWMAINTWA